MTRSARQHVVAAGRWLFARPNLMLLALVAAVFFFSFSSASDARHNLCEQSNRQTAAIKNLVDVTFPDNQSDPPRDLTALQNLPAWQAIDDPDVKALLLILLQGGQDAPASSTRERLEAFADSLEFIDC